MIVSIVTIAVLLFAAAIVAAYFYAVSRVLAKVVRKQERQHRRDIRRGDQLLDRLVMKHGFTPLGEPVKHESSAVLTMPIADPLEAAESEWEREDRERFKRMTALGDDEKAELIAEARTRVG